MKQVIQSYKTGELWLADTVVPACKAGGVLVQTKVSFMSAGTERRLVDFARKNLIGKALAMPDQVKKVLRKIQSEGLFSTLEKVQAKMDQPIPLGYSCSGVVVEVGEEVRGLRVGDRVACGGAGFANHAEFNYVPKNLVVIIPEEVTFTDASCATVGSIALQGIRQCNVRLGESVCVMGLGLLGLLAVQMLKAAGCRVIGYDPKPSRCDLAKALGADTVVSEGIEAAAAAFSSGYGVDAVLITAATKSNEPVTLAGDIVRHKGTVVVTGVVGIDVPRDSYYRKELDLKLSLSYGAGRYDVEYEEGGHDYPYGYVRWTEQRNIKAFLDLLAEGKITPAKLVTHHFDLEHVLDAYELLAGKIDEPYVGIVIDYPAKEEPYDSQRCIDIRLPAVEGEAVESSGSIGVGFIGGGHFSKGVLLPKVKKLDEVRLTGLCTVGGMNTAETARKEGFVFGTTDYHQLLSSHSVDAVFVTTPHNTHAEFLGEALQAGKHVFVEKPLAVNRKQLEQFVGVWNHLNDSKSSPIFTVGYNRRFSPHAHLIKSYFSSRNTPLVVNYRVNAGMVPKTHWIQDLDVGGGCIVGEVCHFVDFVSYIVDSPVEEVKATCVTLENSALVAEDNAAIHLKYGDGSIANICYVALGSPDLPKERCELFSSESVVVLDDFCSTRCFGKLGRKQLRGKQNKGYAEEIKSFIEGVQRQRLPIPVTSLLNTTLVTFAVNESLRSGDCVKVDTLKSVQ